MEYDYTCTNCNHNWTETQKLKDPVTKVCPECKQETAKRLISGGTSFVLLGNGWAKDSYK